MMTPRVARAIELYRQSGSLTYGTVDHWNAVVELNGCLRAMGGNESHQYYAAVQANRAALARAETEVDWP